ncbi:glutathione S-transferase C-terminal-like protein [Fomitopsis schrenkii]|uniref:glutathione transferase n=1 Tax=Fomitopsis schrenkii TaxID=2126942 RepID=S8FF31_FOMSC|nr:glutathione S-transferase C-terminal-like protein [Fomitopsis schrenkii]
MSHGNQFTLYTYVSGPNGWKVAYVLAELGLTYESRYLDFGKEEQKSLEYTKYNPNGRIPTLIDHSNGDFVIWESGAILQYLVDMYDTEHKISVSDIKEKYHQLQWLFFQASGQGPYYGQASWFILYHPEKVPSVLERYGKEIVRVLGVLEGVLSKQEWLVGGKYTVADIAFVPWHLLTFTQLPELRPEVSLERDFPSVYKWHNAVISRKPIAELVELRESLIRAAGK